jgi:uncharacterized protein (DUF1800 family)
MKVETLWSLRLGYSRKQSANIKALGLEEFLRHSFVAKFDSVEPDFLNNEPKSIEELQAFRAKIQTMSPEESKILAKQRRRTFISLKSWWIDKMQNEPYPLREKMTCFWQNHFVATAQKVKVNHWLYQLNMLLRENAFGNFRDITKKVIRSNAMVRYLDNVDNRKGQINENLSRELLELFTLGIDNYNEADVRNGAKALAGLGIGEKEAQYRRPFEINERLTYLGRTGHFKADDIIDIIFEQEAIPYLITRKILQWFIYDNPKEDLVRYYGDYFRHVDFEVMPLLTKIFTEEYGKDNAASKIKDPLVFILQLLDELGVSDLDTVVIAFFLQQQGMDLFNQPNVKGWVGGNAWLTSQIYLQRQNISDLLCSGRSTSRKTFEDTTGQAPLTFKQIDLNFAWNADLTSAQIIDHLYSRLITVEDDQLRQGMENILKYDFDPKSPNADQVVLRLFNYMTKAPEYQLI